jgi:hypothetical protein
LKKLLTWLTLVGVAAVVVVLAVYLIQIAVALTRANRNLARLVDELEAVRDNAALLGGDLATINREAVALRDQLLRVDGHLSGIVRLVRGEGHVLQKPAD